MKAWFKTIQMYCRTVTEATDRQKYNVSITKYNIYTYLETDLKLIRFFRDSAPALNYIDQNAPRTLPLLISAPVYRSPAAASWGGDPDGVDSGSERSLILSRRRTVRFKWPKRTITSSSCCWSETAGSARHVCCSDSARTPSTPPSYLQ